MVPVDLFIPGCPPHPLTILDGLLRLLDRLEEKGEFTPEAQDAVTSFGERISSGIVTMVINQNVSSPQAPAAGGIQSPSFQNRSFQTQLTVQDGDTVAIGGIIQESNLQSSAGVPFLHRLPGVGALFGAQSVTKSRTELVVFLTPRVIYDTNQMVEATDEIRSNMRKVGKLMKDQ